MSTTENELPEHAARIIAAMEAINERGPAATEDLAAIYADDVVFSDSVNSSRGKAAILEMTRRYAVRAREVRFHVDRDSVTASGDRVFYAWTWTFAGKFGPRIRVEGVSRLRLRDGVIVYHRDYFDVLGSLLGSLPRVQAAYKAFARMIG